MRSEITLWTYCPFPKMRTMRIAYARRSNTKNTLSSLPHSDLSSCAHNPHCPHLLKTDNTSGSLTWNGKRDRSVALSCFGSIAHEHQVLEVLQ